MAQVIRKLRIWEVSKLLSFRRKYDYQAPFMVEDGVEGGESSVRHILKMVWHRERMTTFLVKEEGEILGYISMVFGRRSKFYGNAYLVSAAVKDGERGRGLGTKLFEAVEGYARQRGVRRIEFDVFAENKRALKLYKRLGYEVEGIKRRAVENDLGSDDLIIMAKFL